jgi:hypothetical protein
VRANRRRLQRRRQLCAVCTGSACVATTPDGQCVDANGGLAQLCCSNNTKLSCFPTRDGGSIVRNGTAGVPSPAWPEPTYPKTADATLVSTFCESATGSTASTSWPAFRDPARSCSPSSRPGCRKRTARPRRAP